MIFCDDEAPIVAGFVWALAAWTLLVHIAVATGGSFTQLLEWSPLVAIVAAIGWYSCRTKEPHLAELAEPSAAHRILWLLPAALVLGSYRFGYFWFWISALLLLTAAWFWLTFGKQIKTVASTPPRKHRVDAIGLAALCSACVFITLLLHQPDIDDAFYISVAADAHRHPGRAIWSTDTIHDDPNLPVFLPIYKAETYEYLIALAARVLHISSIRAAHTALPIMFSIFVALAWAQLARVIDPRNWLAIAAVTIVIALLAGAAKQGPANYTFTRLQQGKSVMLSAIVPILCVCAWRLATMGGWRNTVMLAAAQIAGVGLSSTCIVIGPAVVCAVGFLCLPSGRRRSLSYPEEPGSTTPHPALRGTSEIGVGSVRQLLPRLILIGATCIYPIAMALLMRNKMLAVTWLAVTPAKPVAVVLTDTLGDRAQLWFFLAAIVGAWAVAPRRAQALLLAPGILLLAVMINPLLTHFLQTDVFTPNTFWRGLWVMPWLAWSATFLCGLSAMLGSIAGFKRPWLSRLIAVSFGAAVLIILLGRHPLWRQQNGTHIRFGGLAVDEPEYTVAKMLSAQTPPGTAALAPERVACWTAVQDQRPPLIFVRSFYTQSTAQSGGMQDLRLRNQLGEIAAKGTLDHDDLTTLLAGTARYRLGSIVLSRTAGNEVADALCNAGYEVQTIGKYALWIRHRF